MQGLRAVTAALFAAGVFISIPVTPPAIADIDLELRPASQTLCLGHTYGIGLYAVSDDPNAAQTLSAMDVIIAWDPNHIQLLGNVDPGTPVWFVSTFIMPDAYGLNESNPPQDGDGIYTALAQPGQVVDATPEGTLITTFQFATLAGTTSTLLEIVESAGNPVGRTRVFSGDEPNLEVTGSLSGSQLAVVDWSSCPADIYRDGQIDISDLGQMLPNYGMESGASPEDGDVDCDGDVDISDLGELLSVYDQPCP
jgi:hypothetical protein